MTIWMEIDSDCVNEGAGSGIFGAMNFIFCMNSWIVFVGTLRKNVVIPLESVVVFVI